MTKTHLLVKTLLILFMISGCSRQDSYRPESSGVDNTAGNAAGIAVFGDARLGVIFN